MTRMKRQGKLWETLLWQTVACWLEDFEFKSEHNGERDWIWKPYDNSRLLLHGRYSRKASKDNYFNSKHNNFHHCIYRKCFDPYRFPKCVVPSSAIEDFVSVPCEHWLLRGAHICASNYRPFNVSRPLYTLLLYWYIWSDCKLYFLWSIFEDTHCNKCGQAPRPDIEATIQTSGNFKKNLGRCCYVLAG